jgi:hypothetical protein
MDNSSIIKSSIVTFLICVVSSQILFAQEAAVGIKGGLNLTTLSVSDPQNSYDTKAGYHAGFFFREKFGKVAIQPEILLSTFSADVNTTLVGDVEDSFTYLAIPVMMKFYIIDGLNIHAGPQFSFLIDGERTGKSRLFGESSTDIKDYYESTDMSVSVGAGWDFGFGLGVDLRYNLGVKDINNWTEGRELKSGIFQVSASWNFLR